MSIQPIANDLANFALPSISTSAVTLVSLLSMFTQRAWGANSGSGICTLGQTAAFFTPDCPAGWEPIDSFGTRHIKITNNSSLVGTLGGFENPTLSEENIPLHTHKLSGAPEGSGGTNLGYGPYSSIGEENYRLEGTTHSVDTFDSGSYGKESPIAIPEHPFVYGRLCNCTSDGAQTIKSLMDRLDKLDDSKGSTKAISVAGLVTGLVGTLFALGNGIKWLAQRRTVRGAERDPMLD